MTDLQKFDSDRNRLYISKKVLAGPTTLVLEKHNVIGCRQLLPPSSCVNLLRCGVCFISETDSNLGSEDKFKM